MVAGISGDIRANGSHTSANVDIMDLSACVKTTFVTLVPQRQQNELSFTLQAMHITGTLHQDQYDPKMVARNIAQISDTNRSQ